MIQVLQLSISRTEWLKTEHLTYMLYCIYEDTILWRTQHLPTRFLCGVEPNLT
jgi:hypothetical protein